MPLLEPEQVPDVNKTYTKANEYVKYFFGLNLTLIEKVRLRHHVQEALENLAKVDSQKYLVNPEEEAVMGFLYDQFGIPFAYEPAMKTLKGYIDKPFCQYLQIQQERMHLP